MSSRYCSEKKVAREKKRKHKKTKGTNSIGHKWQHESGEVIAYCKRLPEHERKNATNANVAIQDGQLHKDSESEVTKDVEEVNVSKTTREMLSNVPYESLLKMAAVILEKSRSQTQG